VSDSPLEALLEAFDRLDVASVEAMIAPDARLLIADGQRAEGRAEVRAVIEGLATQLRSTSHRVLAQWHQDGVWIAEVEASYELRDWLQLKALPRAFFLREGAEGISELHVYGAHERPITEHRTGEEGMRLGDRWIPPL
jgi:hypothetical protein